MKTHRPRVQIFFAVGLLGVFACQSRAPKTPKKTVQGKGERPYLDPGRIVEVGPSERDRLLDQGLGRIRSGDVGGGLEILYKLDSTNPKDRQVIFHIARTLQQRDQFRAARSEYRRLIRLDEKYALAWLYLGEIEQRLGEHKEAIQAFRQVARLVPKTIDPLRRIAVNQIRRGEAEAALKTLAEGRERLAEAKRDDGLLELLTVRAYEELGNKPKMKIAVRQFLRVSADQPELKAEREYYQQWLIREGLTLSEKDIASLFEFARVSLHLNEDSKALPADIAAKASKRLEAFDETTVFITLRLPGGLGEPLIARGRKQNLLSSSARALGFILAHPKFNKSLYRRCSIRMTLVHGRFHELSLKGPGNSQPEDLASQYVSEPKFIPGVHGVAFDAGDRQPFFLPAEATIYELTRVSEALSFGARRSKLKPTAWQNKRILSFEAREFYQHRPGAAVFELLAGEPAARPEASWSGIWQSLGLAANWLKKQQAPNGAFAKAIRPKEDGRRHFDLGAKAQSFNLEIVEIDRRSTLTVRCPGTPGGPRRLALVDQKLSLRCPAKASSIRQHLSQILGLETAQIEVGPIRQGQDIRVDLTGVSANQLRLAMAGELGQISLRDHYFAAGSLALLYQRMARPEYRLAAQAGIDFAEQLAARYPIDSRSFDGMALLTMTYFDQGLRFDGENPRYEKQRKLIRERLWPQVCKSTEGEFVDQSLEFLACTLAVNSEAFDRQRAELAQRLAVMSGVILRKSRGPERSLFALSAQLLWQRSRNRRLQDFVKKLALKTAAQLVDPAEDWNLAGSVKTQNALVMPTLKNASKALIALSAAVNMKSARKQKSDNEFLKAALVSAEFVRRGQFTKNHGYLVANIESAVGGFRESLFDSRLGMHTQFLSILALSQTLDLIDKAR